MSQLSIYFLEILYVYYFKWLLAFYIMKNLSYSLKLGFNNTVEELLLYLP